ncbi:MAG TPA: Trp biosynthesis-associated membrane protein [Pseudonocardia sp.]|nr:Trp biosynthesis-associated membrane protein [Pseudonocardia sp.]
MTARPGPRLLGAACAGLVVCAGLLWSGSATTWYRVIPAGAAPVELTGAQVAPWLGGVALLALAGVAGVVATGGVLRRLVGALLGLAGAGVLVFGLRALFVDPFATDARASALPQPPPGVTVDALRHQPTDVTAAPLVAVAGAAVLLAVGVLVLVRERRLPRFGARYAAPAERRAERDPDRAAWQELDAGRDPTADPDAEPRGDPGDDPGDGPRNAAV